MQSRQQALEQVGQDLQDRQESLRTAQSEVFAAAQELTRVRNELTALDLQKQGDSIRLEKLSAEKDPAQEERGRLETRLHEFAANVQADKLDAQTKRGSVEDRLRRLSEIQEELNRASHEQDQRLQQQAEKRSRLNVIEQLEGSHEGFGAGALAALRRSGPSWFPRRSHPGFGRFCHRDRECAGPSPATGFDRAARIGPGDSVRAHREQGRAGQRGGLSVEAPEAQMAFAGDMAPGDGAQAARVTLEKGDVVPALSVIRADPSVEKLVRSLLGRTFIAGDLPSATAQLRNGHAGCDFVTLSGDLLSRHGVYTGGYLNGSGNSRAPSSILGRKNQITELQAEVAVLLEQVAEFSRRKGALQGEQTELQSGLQQAQAELRQQEVAIATREGEFAALEASRRLLHQKIDTVVYEIQSLAAQDKEGSEKRAALSAQAAGLETREGACRERVSAITAELDQMRQQRDAANAQLTESRVALASEEQVSASFRQQHAALDQRIRELTQVVEQRRAECASFVGRKEQAEGEIAESRAGIDRLRHDREQVSAQAAELLAQKQSQESNIAAREETLREDRRRLTELQQHRGALEVELAQRNMSVENLRDRIQQKYMSGSTTCAASASRSRSPRKARPG